MQSPKTVMIKVRKTDKFITQVHRKDVLANMLSHTELGGEKLFRKLITDNNTNGNHADRDRKRQGLVFESICQIAMTMKLIQNLDYTEIYEGQPQNLVPISSFNTYMNVKVNGGGSNIVDFVLKLIDTLYHFP